MLEYQRKQHNRKLIYSKISIIVLIVISIYFVKGMIGLYSKVQTASEARAISEAEFKDLNYRKSFVDSEIGRLRTKEGIEREIREKFSVAQPGEELVVIIAGSAGAIPEPKHGFFNRIWEKTKGLFGTSSDDMVE